jgi:metal-sulfur cluster biosynthetic enzyme
MLRQDEIKAALAGIIDPNSGLNFKEMGLIEKVEIDGSEVTVNLAIGFDFVLNPATIFIINSIKRKLHSVSNDIGRVEVKLRSQVWEEQVV